MKGEHPQYQLEGKEQGPKIKESAEQRIAQAKTESAKMNQFLKDFLASNGPEIEEAVLSARLNRETAQNRTLGEKELANLHSRIESSYRRRAKEAYQNSGGDLKLAQQGNRAKVEEVAQNSPQFQMLLDHLPTPSQTLPNTEKTVQNPVEAPATPVVEKKTIPSQGLLSRLFNRKRGNGDAEA